MKAAEQGLEKAMVSLGFLSRFGEGTEKSEKKLYIGLKKQQIWALLTECYIWANYRTSRKLNKTRNSQKNGIPERLSLGIVRLRID